jgi:DNA-damage-inducible protein D
MKNEIDKTSKIAVFKGKEIRKIIFKDEWYFSITDIISVLTDSANPRRYWSDLKSKLSDDEGFSQLYEKIVQLKLVSPDGKKYQTDTANTETILRIIQSIPSPKAEPFKRWLAKVGYERIKEQKEYAILTAEISEATFGLKPSEHQKLKNLKKENLRDHMTDLELIFSMLGEASTTEIAVQKEAQGFEENRDAARAGGKIAGNARKELEEKSGRKVVSSSNFRDIAISIDISELLTNDS